MVPVAPEDLALPSRGLLTMLSERRTRRADLSTLEDFEEYVSWMHGLGAPAVRAWWGSPREARG